MLVKSKFYRHSQLPNLIERFSFPSPFVGPLIPLFWTFGDVSSGFQSQSEQTYFMHILHVLRFTSGATPADVLATTMAAEPFSSTVLGIFVSTAFVLFFWQNSTVFDLG